MSKERLISAHPVEPAMHAQILDHLRQIEVEKKKSCLRFV